MKSILSTATNHRKTSTIALILADILFFSLSDPKNSALITMIVGFVLLALNVFIVCHYLARLLKGTGILKSEKSWAVAGISAFGFILITLQAIGQLSARDIAALIPLVALAYFYFTRVSKSTDY